MGSAPKPSSPPAPARAPSSDANASTDRVIGTLGLLLLIVFVVIATRNRNGAGDGTVDGASVTTVVVPVTATVAVPVPDTVIPPLATAAATELVLPDLRGVVVDRTTANAAYILKIADADDGVVVSVAVPAAVWQQCVIESDFDGSLDPPCILTK